MGMVVCIITQICFESRGHQNGTAPTETLNADDDANTSEAAQKQSVSTDIMTAAGSNTMDQTATKAATVNEEAAMKAVTANEAAATKSVTDAEAVIISEINALPASGGSVNVPNLAQTGLSPSVVEALVAKIDIDAEDAEVSLTYAVDGTNYMMTIPAGFRFNRQTLLNSYGGIDFTTLIEEFGE